MSRDGRFVIPHRRDRGGVLPIALLIAAAIALVGMTVLQFADTETLIITRVRDQEKLLHVAESGARMVKTWFDRPVSGDPSRPDTVKHLFLDRFDLREPAHFDRDGRLIDADGDPATPPVPADGEPGRELYRQGRLVTAGSPHLDLFHKPYRGDHTTTFLGVEAGPDLLLADRPGPDLLDALNHSLFPDQSRIGRIERIAIHSPAGSLTEAGPARYGIATVRVTAARYRRLVVEDGLPQVPAGAAPVARATVSIGLAEIPVTLSRGPLEACGELTAGGTLDARWGRVIVRGDVHLAEEEDRLDAGVRSGWPYASFERRIHELAPGGDLDTWLADPDRSVEDPWLKVLSGGRLIGWDAAGDQPFPHDPALGHDADHSNLFQRVEGLGCAGFDYAMWKRLSLGTMPGDRGLHYFSHDAATGLFREGGRGPARSVRDWTHDREGIFFFDTIDGRDPDGTNLTPPVLITGGSWNVAGIVYLNSVSVGVDDSGGRDRVILPPGEPFDDEDGDGRYDPGEFHLNLRYPSTPGSIDEFIRDPLAEGVVEVIGEDGALHRATTSPGRDRHGFPLIIPVNVYGILYNSGDILLEGKATHYGSLVAGGSMVQGTAEAPTPTVYFDDRLNTGEWPPPGLEMPRTYITFWQTGMH